MNPNITPPPSPDRGALPPRPGMMGPAAASAATRTSRVYYDERGKRRTASSDVQTDQYGHISGVEHRCPECKTTKWVSASVLARGIPVCEVDGRRMAALAVASPRALPWAEMHRAVAPQLRAFWALLAVAALGGGAHAAHIPAVVAVLVAAPAGWLAARVTRNKLASRAKNRGHLADDDTGKRLRTIIARRGRTVGAYTTIAWLWIASAAVTGLDTHTLGGRISWTVLVVLWLHPAATWWRWLRRQRRHREKVTPVPEPEPEPTSDVPMDPDEAQTRQVWGSIVAARKDQVIATHPDGTPAKRAERAGRLVDTWLEDWHKVEGGWAATIVGPDGMYTGDKFVEARSAVASAFKMKTPMITAIPDPEDENRALVLAQRTSPIRELTRWAGPDSIDPEKGTAPIASYADGEPATYEIYRPEWGSPHVLLAGTTGSGKSDAICLLLTIDRWASYVDPAGKRRGMVSSFLIDPQHGQSFAPFLDDLAAPVASDLSEATVLVKALTEEFHRRNVYLAREAETWDPRRKKWRKGRKWWNPLIDGPILSLTIDEAYLFLSDPKFCKLITDAGRMWRKCGGQLRIASHTPLLGDLGGSMALRDMLTGGTVMVFRTANALTGNIAFNGRLPADPRTIPFEAPGTCYLLTGSQPKAMLARTMWERDWYDWVRDLDDKPIGYPAPLPPKTLEAFGPEYAAWVRHAADPDAGLFVPTQIQPAAPEVSATCVDAVLAALATSTTPMDMDSLDKSLKQAGAIYSTRTVRDALAKLRKTGHVHSGSGQHELTPQAREQLPPASDGVRDAA